MIITIVSFILIITVMVTVHELGHMVVAKRLGVKIKTFSVGFGPVLKKFYTDRTGTSYILCLVPFGGYVEFAESPEEKIRTENRFDADSLYLSDRPPLHKILIAFSGPLANLLAAVLVFIPVYMAGISIPAYMEQPAKLGWISSNSPAIAAGLQEGDIITAIDGREIKTWSDFVENIPLTPISLNVAAERQGRQISALIIHVSRLNMGFYPEEKIKAESIIARSPADVAGIKAGDIYWQ
jgi:regulator of sigma E protease